MEAQETKFYTKATPLIIECWRVYGGLKSGSLDGVRYFDNTDADFETGNFYASDSWMYDGFKELTEAEFIKLIYGN